MNGSTAVPGKAWWRAVAVSSGVLLVAIVWALWPTIVQLVHRWEREPTYSHGYLVPLIAGVIAWTRRHTLPDIKLRTRWWPLGLILAGALMQVIGTYFVVFWMNATSLIAYLTGIVALIGGWPLLRWAAPALGFLLFMVPLPHRLANAMQMPLRRVSTLISGYALQVMGLPAVTEGNVIVLNDVNGKLAQLGVVDACSGLKMLIVFFALSAAVALLARRPLLDRVLILASAVPIAILCNVIRITITGLLYATVGEKWGNLVFHDMAGWFMMPMALGFMWLELKLLAWLLPEEADAFLDAGPGAMRAGGVGRPNTGLGPLRAS
jgi:exosortase